MCVNLRIIEYFEYYKSAHYRKGAKNDAEGEFYDVFGEAQITAYIKKYFADMCPLETKVQHK